MSSVAIPITGEPDADRLLQDDPLALLLGMLLDQQVPMEWAFRGPHTLQERLGRGLDASDIAAMDPEELEKIFREKPALHRYPASMAKRAHALCTVIVDEYDGDPAAVWSGAADGADALERIRDLPGYGPEKSKILLAILGKRLGVAPDGWERAARPFSDTTPRSVADIDSPESLEKVRSWKKAQKAKGRKKSD